MSFDLGDPVPLTVETRDADDNLANAGSITLTITLPDTTVVSPSFTNPTVGRYQADYPTVQVGHHDVRWLATGVNSSAYADSFDVLPAAPGYIVSLARAKKKLKIPLSDNEHDEDIRDYVQAATEVVEDHIKLKIVRRTLVDVIHVCGPGRTVVLPHAPVITLISAQTVDGLITWDVGDMDVDGATGVVTVTTGPLLRGRIRFVYAVGMPVILAKYMRAALIIIEHLWQTERAQSEAGPFPGAYEDTAEGMRFRGGQGYAIPNRALELLGKPAPMVG